MSLDNTGTEFFEDTDMTKSFRPNKKIKGLSIEGFFYKKFSKYKTLVRISLVLLSFILLGISIYFIVLAYGSNSEEERRARFEQKISNTKLK